MGRNHKTIDRDISACRAPEVPTLYNVQLGKLGFYSTGLKVDIHQGVQFVEHNIYIIGANTGRNNGKAGFANVAGMGNEFPVVTFMFYAVEMFANGGYPVGVANGNNCGCKFLGAEVEMVYGPRLLIINSDS